MPRRWPFLLLLAAPLLSAALPGCGRERVKAPEAFVYVRGKDSPHADPALATDGESAILINNVFDGLVRYKYGGFDIEPALAVSWEEAKDRLSTTFRIRDGVKFHDGTPCDAAAVATSFERQRDLKHRFHFTKGAYPYWGDMFGFVSKVEATDASTVKFTFSEPAPLFFLQLLGMFSASVVSPKALERGENWVERNPVGTGAFRFVSWTAGQEIVLDRNPDWWGGTPKVGRVVLQVKPDPHDGYLLLEAGQVHGIDNVAARDVARAEGNPSLALHRSPARLSVCYLVLNNQVPPFTDPRVRRAVALAIDKPRIVRAAYEGIATAASTLVPPDMDASLDLSDRAKDTAAARRLLEEAGVVGMKVALQFPSNARPYMPNPDALATQVREDLKDVGLDVELKKEEWAPYLSYLEKGMHSMGLIGWTPDIPDPDNYLHVLLGKGQSNNYSFYASDAFTGKTLAARRSTDPAERHRLYLEAQKIAFEDCPIVPLVVMPRTAATLAKVKGFTVDPMASPRFAWTSRGE